MKKGSILTSLTLLCLIYSTSGSSSMYSLSEAVDYNTDDIDFSLSSLNSKFNEYIDESQGYSYYEFNIDLSYTFSVNDGSLFILLDLPYEEDSGFNIKEITKEITDTSKNVTTDPISQSSVKTIDQSTYPVLKDYEFLMGEYYKVQGQYNETTTFDFSATFSPILNSFNFDIHLIYTPTVGDSVNTTLHVVSGYQIAYNQLTTQNKNGFVPAPFPALYTIFALPVAILLKKVRAE